MCTDEKNRKIKIACLEKVSLSFFRLYERHISLEQAICTTKVSKRSILLA